MIEGVKCNECQTDEHLVELPRHQIEIEDWGVIPASQIIEAHKCTKCGGFTVVAHHWLSPKR